MKQPEYIEGGKATENFEEGMKALFKVPKDRFAKIRPKKRTPKTSSVRRTKRSDKD
jgi:hypothetical protein